MGDMAVPIREAVARGEQLLDAGEPLAAAELLRSCLGSAPGDYWLNLWLGQACSALDDRTAATEHFLVAARSRDPEPVRAYYELARLALARAFAKLRRAGYAFTFDGIDLTARRAP